MSGRTSSLAALGEEEYRGNERRIESEEAIHLTIVARLHLIVKIISRGDFFFYDVVMQNRNAERSLSSHIPDSLATRFASCVGYSSPSFLCDRIAA